LTIDEFYNIYIDNKDFYLRFKWYLSNKIW